jgi:hypothetical protein
MITVIADKIRTSLLFDSTRRGVIAPQDILEPPSANAMDVGVNLDDLLVITSPKLRTKYSNHPAIEIRDALKSKSWIARLPLCAIVVPGGAGRPLDMNNVHRTTAPGKTNFVIALARSAQFGYVSRQKDILILHFNHCINELNEKQAYLRYADMAH